MKLPLAVALTSALGCAAAAAAHHSIAGMYDESHPVRLEGSVAEFHFVNPHPFVLLLAKDDRGRDQTWRLEMDNRGELVEVGMSAATLKAGDRLTVSGSPAWKQPNALYVRKMERADGFRYEQVGFSPKISGPR